AVSFRSARARSACRFAAKLRPAIALATFLVIALPSALPPRASATSTTPLPRMAYVRRRFSKVGSSVRRKRSMPMKTRTTANPALAASKSEGMSHLHRAQRRARLEEAVGETEDARWQADARVLDLRHELRSHACGLHPPDDFAALKGFLLEHEHVLEGDDLAL